MIIWSIKLLLKNDTDEKIGNAASGKFISQKKTKTLKEGFFERATQNMWEFSQATTFIQNKLPLNFHLLFLSSSFSVGSGDYRVCNSSLPDIMNVEMVALRKVTKE